MYYHYNIKQVIAYLDVIATIPVLPSLSAFSSQLIINEAAAQFCMRDNALLLRRVELFSLARQVARKCAYTSTLKHAR